MADNIITGKLNCVLIIYTLRNVKKTKIILRNSKKRCLRLKEMFYFTNYVKKKFLEKYILMVVNSFLILIYHLIFFLLLEGLLVVLNLN